MLADVELENLRTWWRYAFQLRAHVAARPDDVEAGLMLATFGSWLRARPEWRRLVATSLM